MTDETASFRHLTGVEAAPSNVAHLPGRRPLRDYVTPVTWPFWGSHIAAVVLVAVFGWSWTGFALAVGGYYLRLFFVTAGYHRYFSHRAYKTSRWFQFVLALGATLTSQKGVLWWAANHRHHHKASDTTDDLHSPRHGFWWSHVGWIAVRDFEKTRWQGIKDMARFPELRWLNKWFLVPPVALAVILYMVGGPWLLIWGFFVPTVLAWHGTFTINSLSHVFGKVRYDTGDDSKNNIWLALLTLGEGWHNNHHHYQRSANQGFRWYEVDITYYLLVALSWVGIVWDVHRAPKHVVEDKKKVRATAMPAPQELDRAA